jgi:predicted ester cyclase
MIDEVLNAGCLDVIEELYSPQMAPGARRWITPFREAFPDVQMEIVDLIAEGEQVAGRFRCSAESRPVARPAHDRVALRASAT